MEPTGCRGLAPHVRASVSFQIDFLFMAQVDLPSVNSITTRLLRVRSPGLRISQRSGLAGQQAVVLRQCWVRIGRCAPNISISILGLLLRVSLSPLAASRRTRIADSGLPTIL